VSLGFRRVSPQLIEAVKDALLASEWQAVAPQNRIRYLRQQVISHHRSQRPFWETTIGGVQIGSLQDPVPGTNGRLLVGDQVANERDEIEEAIEREALGRYLRGCFPSEEAFQIALGAFDGPRPPQWKGLSEQFRVSPKRVEAVRKQVSRRRLRGG